MTKEPVYCLIVEDDYYISEFLKKAIGQPDVYVLSAENGEQALEIIATGASVDIIITDLNMPKMGGEELIKKVRETSPRTLIIVMTGHASVSSVVSLMKQGIFDYLTKPVELDNFLTVFDRAVEQVEMFRQKNITGNIAQIWHIGQWMDRHLTPEKLLMGIIETSLKISRGDGVAIFLRLEEYKWNEGAIKGMEPNFANNILEKVCKDIGIWTGIGQEEINGNLLKILDTEQGKVIASPFVENSVVVSILLILIKGELDSQTPGLLAMFCSQISPIINMSIDITKLLNSQEEAIKAHADLEKAQEELIQSTKLACIGELSAGIAHDINTPLTCILGFIRLFIRFLDKPDISVKELLAIRHYLEKACSETERCQEILNSLLLFSRKESKKYCPFSFKELVDRSHSLLEKQFETSNIVFIKDLPESLPNIIGNSNQIQQVIMNIMLNAKNAMPSGGKITIHARDIGDGIKINISDTGKGIPKENLGKIFEPFFTTNMSGKGTGLGLSISKKIIMEHGGEIKVESEIGKGSMFSITLKKA